MKKILTILLLWTLSLWAQNSITEIDFAQAKRIYNAGSGLFIDARELKFYKKGTILGALNMPIQRFKRMKRLLPAKKSSKLVVFCGGIKCEKSTKLAKLILAEGYSHIMVYRGGFPEWSQKGQEIMLSATHCQHSSTPTSKPVTLQGATVQLGSEKGMIDAEWFVQHLQAGTLSPQIQLVDVRRSADHTEGHLPHSLHIRWDSDTGQIDSSRFPADKLTLLYCNTGMLSSDAYDSLDAETAKRVLYLNAVVKCKEEKCEVIPNRY